MAALNQALLNKTTVHRAMFRNGLGWVDFEWGAIGRIQPSGRTKGGMGLAHILEARQRKDGSTESQAIRALDDMVDAIAQGKEFDRQTVGTSDRVGLETADAIVWLVRPKGSNAWVVTAYEKNPDGTTAGRATEMPTLGAASLTRSDEGAGSGYIIDNSGELDQSLFDDVQQGATAAELLTRIASESTNARNRAIAAQLLTFGPDATVGFGSKAGATFQAERPHSDFVASYSPKNHHVALYAAENAERNLIHELTHAATAHALMKGGKAALQMKALYADLKRGGLLSGMYGMANVDEFVAEAHSNPAFQAALQAIPLAGKFKSMWARFVDIVRQALGLPANQTDALEYALTVGRALMGENGKGGKSGNPTLFGNIGQTATQAFRNWFGNSKVVDADGRPLVVYHGTGRDFSEFGAEHQGATFANDDVDVPRDGFWFSSEPDRAEWYASVSARRTKDGAANLIPSFLKLENPYIHSAEDFANEGLYGLPDLYTLERQGYDGVIIERGEYGEGEQEYDILPVTKRDYAVFKSSQVKSATGNDGGFDPNDPDIMFSRSVMKDTDANIRRGTAAMNNALLNKTTMHRAMYRNGLGWVDFEWGDIGTVKSSGKTRGAMGISHILEARQRKDGMTESQVQRLLGDVVQTIAKGAETIRRDYDDSTNVTLQLGNVQVLLVKNAGSNAWVLTGWKVNPDATRAGYVAPDATRSTATTARSETGAGFTSIIDKTTASGERGASDHPDILRSITRRQFLGAAALAATTGAVRAEAGLGKARPISAAILGQALPAPIAKILRGKGSGITNVEGAQAISAAMLEIARTGPVELRALAAQIAAMMPKSGVMLTVDDTRRMNAHGAVTFTPIVHLQLFTAQGRTGMTYETFLHETLHLVVAARYKTISNGAVRNNDAKLGLAAPNAAKAMAQFTALWDEFEAAAKDNPAKDADTRLSISEAVGNPDEFFVRALTDPKLQAYMAGIEYQGKTLLARFKDWVTGLFFKSGTRPSWLDAALIASNELKGAMPADQGDFARLQASNSLASKARSMKSVVSNDADAATDEDLMGNVGASASWTSGTLVPPEQQLSEQRLLEIVDTALAGLDNAPPFFVLVGPHLLADQVAQAGSVPMSSGGMQGGKIFLFRNGIPDAASALATIWHELFHYGLRKLMTPEAYASNMLRLYNNDTTVRFSPTRKTPKNTDRFPGQPIECVLVVLRWNFHIAI